VRFAHRSAQKPGGKKAAELAAFGRSSAVNRSLTSFARGCSRQTNEVAKLD